MFLKLQAWAARPMTNGDAVMLLVVATLWLCLFLAFARPKD